MNEPLVVSPKDAGRLLKMRASDVYSLIHSGRLAHVRRGNRYLVPVVELEKFVADEIARTAQ
jgi:excisionase family DNA binding protein